MNVYLPLGLLLFIITYFAKNNYKQAKKSFAFCLFVMFVFAAIRYEFGPDYDNYRENFISLKSSDIESYQAATYNHMEIWFVRFFDLFNSYFIYIMVMSLIWHGVMFWFFEKYVSFKYYYIIVLLMFLNVNLCLYNYIAFRSSLASCFFIIGLSCLAFGARDIPILKKIWLLSDNKKINLALYLLFVLVGSRFHTSLLAFLIFPFITRDTNFSKKQSNVLFYIFLIVAVSTPIIGMGLTKSIVLWVMSVFSDSFSRYEGYLGEGVSESGGIGALIINLSKVAMAYPILNALTIEKDSRFIRIMQFSVVFILLLLVVDNNLLSRFMMCFYPVIIVALLRSYLHNLEVNRMVSLFSILLLSAIQFYAVIRSPYSVSFLTYQTIFSAPYWQ